jgi:aminoglycoside/choline kinase family phosphotransferase/GTP:adenosylcobinamide-phosphate guanylyltransferase
MKAMILAAGYGTRLQPFSSYLPKSLFPIAGRPLLDIIISRLQDAGSQAIIINTHHLHQKIDAFIAAQNYTTPIYTRYEPSILGTGGAIKNVADFWHDQPLLVINCDIVTDIDLRTVYTFHLSHKHPVTLVLHDHPLYNTVSINPDGCVTGFQPPVNITSLSSPTILAFTGIQVIDPEILHFIPETGFFSSIEAYTRMLAKGCKIKTFISHGHYWQDIGTPDNYKGTVFDKMAPQAFKRAWPECSIQKIKRTKLKGDGSDRKWYRLTAGKQSLMMVDHGIRKNSNVAEVDSFVAIGRHLLAADLPVPKIYLDDTFSGFVFLEDLGDLNLQNDVRQGKSFGDTILRYKSVIEHLIKLSVFGAREFDPSWTCQSPFYSREIILEKECRYFVEAFLQKYLNLDLSYANFEKEFVSIAQKALAFATNGFMHRDLQSRNIMLKNNEIYFIDFQGGRMGPIQYDLASLLIDPYVELPYPVQAQLLDYCIKRLSPYVTVDPDKFRTGYHFCTLTRNFQILGAFGHLSKVKGKVYFEQFIPNAVKTLKWNITKLESPEFPKLKSLVAEIANHYTFK